MQQLADFEAQYGADMDAAAAQFPPLTDAQRGQIATVLRGNSTRHSAAA
ncbi:hypothetical protein I5G97_gp066 [Mycobacterium phage Curiosium]|uniref:Uncharacterized protein n=1 Tax=Mycobacterium phage Curiosium TaxID=2599859 RepID=A0A5J6TW00_9CAUD|nr:hypothetical protein I5G97_gp066 [Mycobacterium phage Curiosium]QFG14089.1 hypothetical protein PBI_CURIOSIUM_44 [Mycobacterium phage Curiosium]